MLVQLEHGVALRLAGLQRSADGLRVAVDQRQGLVPFAHQLVVVVNDFFVLVPERLPRPSAACSPFWARQLFTHVSAAPSALPSNAAASVAFTMTTPSARRSTVRSPCRHSCKWASRTSSGTRSLAIQFRMASSVMLLMLRPPVCQCFNVEGRALARVGCRRARVRGRGVEVGEGVSKQTRPPLPSGKLVMLRFSVAVPPS